MGACRDLHALRKDGSEFPVEIGLNPIETEQGTLVLSTIMDITERKRAETRLRTALEEKELLLQEIHHRVKNNLQIISSLLSIQSRRIEDTMVLRTFQNSQSRIESIALIHEILCHTKDLSRIDFGRYVRELAQHLAATYGTTAQDVQVEINVPDVWLSVDQAMPLGLLITELLTNSLLHAFPAGRRGKIRIELDQAESGQLVLTVSDDGVGLPQQMDLQQAHSIGLQLVNKLAEQVHGTVEYHSNRGTQFKMVFCR